MTDEELVRKKLAFILRCVNELRTMARPELIERDVREERFVVHTLQLAIQSALDIAFHIISDERLGEPRSNRDAFEILATHGAITSELSAKLERMAGFRNLVVHGYEVVDLGVVRAIVEHHLVDLVAFASAIDAWMTKA